MRKIFRPFHHQELVTLDTKEFRTSLEPPNSLNAPCNGKSRVSRLCSNKSRYSEVFSLALNTKLSGSRPTVNFSRYDFPVFYAYELKKGL